MKKSQLNSAWVLRFYFALVLLAGEIVWGQGIVQVFPEPQPFYSLGYPGTLDLNIDINGDGTTDFILESGSSDVNYAALIPQGNNTVVTLNSFAADMNGGETVGSSLDPVYQWSNAKTTIGYLVLLLGSGGAEDGNFVGKESGYIGFDVADNGINHYGWMHIENTVSGDAGIYGVVTDWAYQSAPNTPILVGPVPEPSTYALLITGAALLIGRRKHD